MIKAVTYKDEEGVEHIVYEPHPKQLDYHQRTEPNVLFWGGRGSGKSMCGRWDAHLRALAYPGFKYAILRRTYPELMKSHLIEIPYEMKLLGGWYHRTDKIAHYPNGSMGFFSQCQGEQDVLNLLSAEFYLMFFDEVSTFPWAMFAKLAASVRVPKGSGLTAMVRAATNPLGISAEDIDRYWVSKNVELEDDPMYNPNDWFNIRANLEDNPSVDADQYRKRFSGLPAHVRKAWVDGEFSFENALFDFHANRNSKPWHLINELDMETEVMPDGSTREIAKIVKAGIVYRAIDAGWFPDPTVCLWIAHLGNRYVVFHEKIWYKTTAHEIALEILAEDKRLGIPQVAMTFCDPSMDIHTTADVRTIKEIYESDRVPMECSINNREAYATVVHNALATQAGDGLPQIQFYVYAQQGCPYLAKTLPQMRYDMKKPKSMAHHKDDHAVVALAYFLLSHSADNRRQIKTGKALPKWMRGKITDSDRFILGRENISDRR